MSHGYHFGPSLIRLIRQQILAPTDGAHLQRTRTEGSNTTAATAGGLVSVSISISIFKIYISNILNILKFKE